MSDICWRTQRPSPPRRKEEESPGDRDRNRKVLNLTNRMASTIMIMMKRILMGMISSMLTISNLVFKFSVAKVTLE